MRTVARSSPIWQRRPPAMRKITVLPMPMLTSKGYPPSLGFDGSCRSLSPLEQRSCTLVSAGTCAHVWSTFSRRRESSTSLRSRNGKKIAHPTSWKPSGYMGSYCTPRWYYLQGELTSPTWRPCWPFSITVLLYHTPLQGILKSIYGGGDSSSPAPTCPGPSKNPASPQSTMHILMPAQGSESPSQLGPNGACGNLSMDGNPRGGTYSGLKPSASSSSSWPYATSPREGSTSWYMGTTAVSSKDGGSGRAQINPPTTSSVVFSNCQRVAIEQYTRNMSLASRTPPMALPGVATHPSTSYSVASPYPMKSALLSSTSDPTKLVKGAMCK